MYDVIKKVISLKRGSDPVFEVTKVHEKYVVNRTMWKTYREAAKYVREALKSSPSPGRYEIREVHRCETIYSTTSSTRPRSAKRLIEDTHRRGWDMVKRPNKRSDKKAGIYI